MVLKFRVICTWGKVPAKQEVCIPEIHHLNLNARAPCIGATHSVCMGSKGDTDVPWNPKGDTGIRENLMQYGETLRGHRCKGGICGRDRCKRDYDEDSDIRGLLLMSLLCLTKVLSLVLNHIMQNPKKRIHVKQMKLFKFTNNWFFSSPQICGK